MNNEQDFSHQVWELVNAPEYRPLKPRQIARRLGLDDPRDLKRTLKRMVREGRLAWGPKHLVLKGESAAPRVKPTNEIVGVFKKTSGGYGFVTPSGSTAPGREDDIYIARSRTADAANGDLVRVRVSRRKQGHVYRVSGQILEVVERRTHRFVGSYFEEGHEGWVEVDSGAFDGPILVGDAGAKNCRVGDKVVIEMAHFPSAEEYGEGVIIEVLGERGQPGVDTLTVIREFGLPEEFPEGALADARRQAEAFDETIGDDRTDFTGLTVVTIDPRTARDFDDAISLEPLDNGHWRLGVHIADVSHFVPYRSELDNEAFRRGTSVYLPDRVIPMLPEVISNNLASLQPGRVRYCMTAMIEFSAEGVPIATDLHRGAIRSAHRFNYEEIDDYLADPARWKEKLTPDVHRLVGDMHRLAMQLRARRMRRGSLDLVLPEVEIDLDDDGHVCGAHTTEYTESHQVIEEFMLAANEAVARRLVDEKLYFLRRIHEPPTEAKMRDLTKFVQMMGVECDNLQDRFELKRVVHETAQMPEAYAIHFAILRALQKAVYSPREIGHFALASDAYCHFTSPIRRYPDLVIHRMVGELIDGRKPAADFDRLVSLGEHCSDLERRAEQAERELIKLKLLNFLVDKVGMEMEAVVTGVESFGLFAQGLELPAEGMIPIRRLPGDRYQFDRAARTLSGFRAGNDFRLGDHLRVRVASVDPDRRELEFEVVVPGKSTRKSKSGKGSQRPQPRDEGSKRPGRKKSEPRGRGRGSRRK